MLSSSAASSHTCVKHPAYQSLGCCNCECCRSIPKLRKYYAMKNKFVKTDDLNKWIGVLPPSSFWARSPFIINDSPATSMKDEYEAMLQLNRILGDNTVRVGDYEKLGNWGIEYNHMEKGEYLMEKITGPTLYHLMEKLKKNINEESKEQFVTIKGPLEGTPKRTFFEMQIGKKDLEDIINQLEIIKDDLRNNNFEHGDLNSSNILIEADTNKVKLFDPSGMTPEERRQLVDYVYDETRLTNIIKELKKLLNSKW